MGREIDDVTAEVDALSSLEGADDLWPLESLVARFFATPEAADHLAVWFRLFERFPDDDGCGVFWTILHGIEAQQGCARLAVESVRRRPSAFPVAMIERMLNSGVLQVEGMSLLEVLRQAAADDRCPPDARESAGRTVNEQTARGTVETAPSNAPGRAGSRSENV